MHACSALAVLASGSGVSTERETFMDLVKTEITRLNGEVSNRGSMSMVFHHGGVHVSPQLHRTCLCSQTTDLCILVKAACRHASAGACIFCARILMNQSALFVLCKPSQDESHTQLMPFR